MNAFNAALIELLKEGFCLLEPLGDGSPEQSRSYQLRHDIYFNFLCLYCLICQQLMEALLLAQAAVLSIFGLQLVKVLHFVLIVKVVEI